MTDAAAVARRFLVTLEARDWDAWSALLSPDVVYEMPQTRERIRGRRAYLEFNKTYPGDWHLEPKVVVGDESGASVWFGWRLSGEHGEEAGDAQVFLEFGADGLITRVTDFWPEPYEPPERVGGPLERW
jgi:ketosteroid isomerase-like protein